MVDASVAPSAAGPGLDNCSSIRLIYTERIKFIVVPLVTASQQLWHSGQPATMEPIGAGLRKLVEPVLDSLEALATASGRAVASMEAGFAALKHVLVDGLEAKLDRMCLLMQTAPGQIDATRPRAGALEHIDDHEVVIPGRTYGDFAAGRTTSLEKRIQHFVEQRQLDNKVARIMSNLNPADAEQVLAEGFDPSRWKDPNAALVLRLRELELDAACKDAYFLRQRVASAEEKGSS